VISPLYRAVDWLRHAGRRRTWNPGAALGRRGEDAAHRYLRGLGYTVVGRNYRTSSGSGEVDIIAWDGMVLVFVEVKSRSTGEFSAPDRSIGQEKQLRLFRAAREYLRRANLPWNQVRFDTVSVIMEPRMAISHARDVFRIKEPV